MGFRRILYVDPEPASCTDEPAGKIAKFLSNAFPPREMSVQIVHALSPETGSPPPDLILFRPPSIDTLSDFLRLIRKTWNRTPLIGLFCARWKGPSEAFQPLIESLDDFVSCPFREIDLIPRIRRLLSSGKERLSPVAQRTFGFEEMVGESESFVREAGKIVLLTDSDAPVLISGETGTGKELFARAIHYHGRRRGGPFIPVNCGALPDHLFENELFGHAKGAFTDAASDEKGLIAEAEGGTLFLDEADTLSPSAQIKLLRFLQDREYRPLGSSKSRIADVRILAATNTDLNGLVQAKRFREDLYYRLHVLSLFLPPLRERIADIPLLARHFLIKYGRQYGKETLHFSSSAMEKLLAYSWPGNVRELEGIVERAVILTASSTLEAEQIALSAPSLKILSKERSLREVKRRTIIEFERTYLTNLLISHGGNVTHAAKTAGKKRQTLQKLLRKYGLERSAFRSESLLRK